MLEQTPEIVHAALIELDLQIAKTTVENEARKVRRESAQPTPDSLK